MPTATPAANDARADVVTEEPDWPPAFPHRAIEDLIDRLEHAASVELAEGVRLLREVVNEAARLRATVARLVCVKLAEADRVAEEILADAKSQADALRAAGLRQLAARVEDAQSLSASVNEANRVSARALRLVPAAGEPTDSTTRVRR